MSTSSPSAVANRPPASTLATVPLWINGQKTGAGWYKYEAGSRERIPDPLIDQLATEAAAKRGIARRTIDDDEILARITTSLANEGARVLEDRFAIRAGDIDSIQNLSRQKIYVFHGYNDKLVARAATDATAEFYRHFLGAPNRGNLYYQTTVGAGHSLVVLPKPGSNGLNGCNENDPPYIDQCAYDQAGILLQHIYGALKPPNRGQLSGTIRQFARHKPTGSS